MSKNPFTAPLEVDRELYEIRVKRYKAPVMFPAPREVDRELYKFDYKNTELYTSKFPAPREVDR